MCCTVQEFGPLAQAWNIRLETDPRRILVSDFIQGADAVDDSRHPSEQDRDEARHRAENKGWRRCLRHHLRELLCVRCYKVHIEGCLDQWGWAHLLPPGRYFKGVDPLRQRAVGF